MPTYQDPHLADLQAMGVMFASPPVGSVNMAGIVFDVSGEPTQIQNPAGVLKDFPGGEGGGIPIPANNDGADVQIESAPGGSVEIRAVPDVAGEVGGGIQIIASDTSADEFAGGNVVISAGNSTGVDADGGQIELTAGLAADSATGGASVLMRGANATDGEGGSLELRVGHGAAGAGSLVIGATSGSMATATGTEAVTTSALGPVAGAVSIAKWIPVTVDGTSGFIPFFTLD